AFAPGQVYVALSRCTSLNGVILKSQITSAGLHTDPLIVKFSERNASEDSLKQELHQSKKQYQQNLLLSLFDFTIVAKQYAELFKTVKDNAAAFNADLPTWITEIESKCTSLQAVAEKFRSQLNKLFQVNDLP